MLQCRCCKPTRTFPKYQARRQQARPGACAGHMQAGCCARGEAPCPTHIQVRPSRRPSRRDPVLLAPGYVGRVHVEACMHTGALSLAVSAHLTVLKSLSMTAQTKRTEAQTTLKPRRVSGQRERVATASHGAVCTTDKVASQR